MSLHRSLQLGSQLTRSRSVLTRWERLQRLRQDGKWETGQDIFGLPKVKTLVIKKAPKKAKKVEEGAEAAAAAAGVAPTAAAASAAKGGPAKQAAKPEGGKGKK